MQKKIKRMNKMAVIIDGKEVAKAKREQIKARVEKLKNNGKKYADK